VRIAFPTRSLLDRCGLGLQQNVNKTIVYEDSVLKEAPERMLRDCLIASLLER
jgi:hypothetical protein